MDIQEILKNIDDKKFDNTEVQDLYNTTNRIDE